MMQGQKNGAAIRTKWGQGLRGWGGDGDKACEDAVVMGAMLSELGGMGTNSCSPRSSLDHTLNHTAVAIAVSNKLDLVTN